MATEKFWSRKSKHALQVTISRSRENGLKVLGFRDNRPFRQNWWDMLIYGDEPGYEFEDLEDLG